MADTEIMTAERITAPVIEVQLLGEKRELRFDNRTAMLAERYWRETLGQRVSYFFILGELNARTYGGALAICYAAMTSAIMHRNLSRKVPEPVMSARAFETEATFDEILTAMEDIRKAVNESLPQQKNAESPGGTGAKDGHGTPSRNAGSAQAEAKKASGTKARGR